MPKVGKPGKGNSQHGRECGKECDRLSDIVGIKQYVEEFKIFNLELSSRSQAIRSIGFGGKKCADILNDDGVHGHLPALTE